MGLMIKKQPLRRSVKNARLLFIGLWIAMALPSMAQVSIERTGGEWSPYGSYLSNIRLSNPSKETISFEGYAPESPVYVVETRQLGGWKDEDASWCGVGLREQHMPAGGEIRFQVAAPEGRAAWRVGVYFSAKGGRHSSGVWTQPIAGLDDRGAGKGGVRELVRTEVAKDPDRKFPYTFTLTNISARPLYYGGFRGATPPIYLNQIRRLGFWKDDGQADWCGKDIAIRPLPPGRSLSFSIPAQSLDSTWRIGMRLYKSPQPVRVSDAFPPVWWPPLPPRGRG